MQRKGERGRRRCMAWLFLCLVEQEWTKTIDTGPVKRSYTQEEENCSENSDEEFIMPEMIFYEKQKKPLKVICLVFSKQTHTPGSFHTVVICWMLPKWAKDVNKQFIEMEMQMAWKHERMLVSLIREMQTQTTGNVIFHLLDWQESNSLISQGCEALVKSTVGIFESFGDLTSKNSLLLPFQPCCLSEISSIPAPGVALMAWSLLNFISSRGDHRKLGRLLRHSELCFLVCKMQTAVETQGKQPAPCLAHNQ